MNKNSKPQQLATELAAMPRALIEASLSNGDQAVILARIVNGMSKESWRKTSEDLELDQWHVFAVPADTEISEENTPAETNFAISPFREAHGALTNGMFLRLLQREILRLNRNGGCLSLLAASLGQKKQLETALGEGTVKRLEILLGETILEHLEDCDCLGILRKDQYICSLPGLGQLAARNLAERVRLSFEDAACPYFPNGGINAGQRATCAIGIVNILQGENVKVTDLIKRAKSSLEIALHKNDCLIHQESSFAPLENTTLVQSSEKRFLFFGGDPK